MNRISNFSRLFSFISLLTLSLAACGSGSGGGSVSSNSNTYKIAESFKTGASVTYNITGSDTTGGTYTGIKQIVIDGPETVDGKSVIQERIITILSKSDFWTSSSTETILYNEDKSEYKVIYSSGLTALPINNFIPPTSVKVGDSGPGNAWNFSDGTIVNSTWEVTDAGGGNATMTVLFYRNSALSQKNTSSFTPDGTIISKTMTLYDFPSLGVTTTLSLIRTDSPLLTKTDSNNTGLILNNSDSPEISGESGPSNNVDAGFLL